MCIWIYSAICLKRISLGLDFAFGIDRCPVTQNKLTVLLLLICITKDIYFYHLHRNLGSSWSWSYGSWIYNYLCNHYHHKSCEFDSCSWWGVLDTTLCDKVCQWLAAGLGFSTFINKNWPPRYEWNIVFVCLWLVSVFYRFENLWFTVI